MISLKNFLEKDEEKNKYELPFGFWGTLKYQIIVEFSKNLPFINNLFITNGDYLNYYWYIIINYLKNKIPITISDYSIILDNIFLMNNFDIKHVLANDILVKGHGAHQVDKEIALSKALGEFLERFFTRMPQTEDRKNILANQKYGKYRQNFKICRDYHDFDEEQKKAFPYLVFDDESEFDFIKVRDLKKQKDIFYPAQQIFWRYVDDKEFAENKPLLSKTTTSGCAGGFSLPATIVSAIYELCERDSFLCYWLTKTTPSQITIKNNEFEIYDYLFEKLKRTNYEIVVLDTTTDLNIPACVAVLRNKIDKTFALSGGAGSNYRQAIESALKELPSCTSVLESEDFTFINDDLKPVLDENFNRAKRLNLFTHAKYIENSFFLFSGEKVEFANLNQGRTFDSKEKELDFLEQEFEDIYCFQSKDKILKDLGYFVVRVVIPELYPLYLIESYKLSKSKRLDKFYKWKTNKENFEINPWPHPFP